MTLEEMKALPEGKQKALYNKIKEIRNLGKVVNFSSVYGAGPPKIAQSTGMPLHQAKRQSKTPFAFIYANRYSHFMFSPIKSQLLS